MIMLARDYTLTEKNKGCMQRTYSSHFHNGSRPTVRRSDQIHRPKHLSVLLYQLRREEAKVILRQSCNKEGSRNNVIEVLLFIEQRTVQREAEQLTLVIADQCYRVFR